MKTLQILFLTAIASHAAQIPVGTVAENQFFAVRGGNQFTNASLNSYEGKILVVMMMTPWCPFCQSNASAVGDGILGHFNATSRGNLRGKNSHGIPIESVMLSTEEAQQWDSVNASFASTNGYDQWGLDANANRSNPRKLLGYFRGGFINSANLYDWGNDRRRVVVLNLVKNSESHDYREIVINQNSYTSADNAAARAAINAIKPMAAVVAPAITSQPQAVNIDSGGTATLRVTASGTSPTFQWYVGASGVTSAPISGATSASYTTTPLSSSRTYWVRASNGSGSANSAAATVTVTPAPVTTSFSQWRSSHPFPIAESGPNDDPDGDGIVNLLEFFSGYHPLQSTSTPALVTLGTEGGGRRLFYRRAKNLSGHAVEHRHSTDLKTWQAIPEANLTYQVVDRGTHEDVTVTLPAATGSRYYCVAVIIP
jgi:Ig-like domain CHU_C associated